MNGRCPFLLPVWLPARLLCASGLHVCCKPGSFEAIQCLLGHLSLATVQLLQESMGCSSAAWCWPVAVAASCPSCIQMAGLLRGGCDQEIQLQAGAEKALSLLLQRSTPSLLRHLLPVRTRGTRAIGYSSRWKLQAPNCRVILGQTSLLTFSPTFVMICHAPLLALLCPLLSTGSQLCETLPMYLTNMLSQYPSKLIGHVPHLCRTLESSTLLFPPLPLNFQHHDACAERFAVVPTRKVCTEPNRGWQQDGAPLSMQLQPGNKRLKGGPAKSKEGSGAASWQWNSANDIVQLWMIC